ncbi:hypothetical protein PBY51_009950 [Eleginops maclovinus]|nr:hypothetical protein PBY51_009950 [Eleginops maclovinus]
MTLQVPAAKKPEPGQRIYKKMVRRLPTGNLDSKKAEAQPKTETSQSPAQKFSSVNKGSSKLTCLAIGQKPAEAQVNKKGKKAEPKGATEEEEDLKICLGAKSERSRAIAVKMRLRRKLVKRKQDKLDLVGCIQKAAGGMVIPVPESSQQHGGTAMEGNTTKTHNKPHKQPKPDRNTFIQKNKMKAQVLKVPGVEGTATTAQNNAAIRNPTTAAPETSTRPQQEPQDPAVKPKKRCKAVYIQPNHTGNVPEKEKHGDTKGELHQDTEGGVIWLDYQVEREEQWAAITSEAAPKAVPAGGRWHPFTVNPSCSHKERCHNAGTSLPSNVQEW